MRSAFIFTFSLSVLYNLQGPVENRPERAQQAVFLKKKLSLFEEQ